MYLLIDMSVHKAIRLALFDVESKHEKKTEGENRELLECIDSFFRKYNADTSNLKGIAVVVGEGSFTSTRIAVTIANTFGYALQIPLLTVSVEEAKDEKGLIEKIDRRPKGEYISATYSGEPNIGKKKTS